MLRIIILALLIAGVMLALVTTSAPARAACERIGCFEECRWVGPGHRRCRRVCQRRCWNDAPRYYAPEPQQRYHAPEPHYQAGPPFDPGAVVAFGLAVLVIAAIVAAIAGSSSDTTARDIAEIDRSTEAMHAQADAYAQQREATYEDIARQEHAAFLEGRADAEREWEQSHRR